MLTYPVKISGRGNILSGESLPSSPVNGQEFIHTPAGRAVSMLYYGGAWRAMRSLGGMTMYVDGASGTDDPDKGFGTGADAFATIQYAVDQIPGLVGGIVTINIASGTYTEPVVIQGKAFTGNYYILIRGTMTNVLPEVSNADITSSQTIGKTGSGWSANAYRRKSVRISGGTGLGQRGIIESNTSDTLTICRAWSATNSEIINGLDNGDNPDSTSDFVVEDWGTVIDNSGGSGADHCILVTGGQQNVVVQDLKLVNASARVGFHVINGAAGEAFNCFGTGGRPFHAIGASNFYLRSILATNSNSTGCVLVQNGTKFDIYGVYVYDAGGSRVGCRIDNNSVGTLYGCTIDNSGSHGLYAQSGAMITMGFTSDTHMQFLNNGGWGVLSETGSLAQKASDADNTYSGNSSGTYSPTSTPDGGTT